MSVYSVRKDKMEREALRIGLIGYGTIGQEVARLLAERVEKDMVLVGALVRNPIKARPPGQTIFPTLSELLSMRPHVVVEVAGHEGLRAHGSRVLRAGIDLIFISAGVLAESETSSELLAAAQHGGAQMKLVSGAIGGLDALAAASLGGLTRVIHTMRKPPEALLPSEEASRVVTVCEVFRGTARQAALRFPEFLNVAATVALAGAGFDQTEVRVLADPTLQYTRHEILAEGAFGLFRFEIENATNIPQRGARLVALSIIHALLQRRAAFIIG
jgi:aspartate dehydrogenase